MDAANRLRSGSTLCWNQIMGKKFIFGSFSAIADAVSAALVTTVVTKSKFSVDPILALLWVMKPNLLSQ